MLEHPTKQCKAGTIRNLRYSKNTLRSSKPMLFYGFSNVGEPDKYFTETQ